MRDLSKQPGDQRRAIASLHVNAWSTSAIHWAWRDLAWLQRDLRGVDGLRFVKVLGTGRASSTAPSIDPRRVAMFAIWDNDAALDRFETDHWVVERWGRAERRFSVRLRLVDGHGSWSNTTILDGLATGTANGPVAMITRATLPLWAWSSFWRTSRQTARSLAEADGLTAALGFGEAPVGYLGTFSLWRSTGAAACFIDSPAHVAAARQAETRNWFTESLFARFEPYQIHGDLDQQHRSGRLK